jgi:hypothetical protein
MAEKNWRALGVPIFAPNDRRAIFPPKILALRHAMMMHWSNAIVAARKLTAFA